MRQTWFGFFTAKASKAFVCLFLSFFLSLRHDSRDVGIGGFAFKSQCYRFHFRTGDDDEGKKLNTKNIHSDQKDFIVWTFLDLKKVEFSAQNQELDSDLSLLGLNGHIYQTS